MAKHNSLGAKGEVAAVNYMIDCGYQILETNWRYRRSEIDIIAQNDECLVFIEVKTRASDHWGNPEEAVTDAKIKRIVEVADYYVQENDIDLLIRFDVISVVGSETAFEIKHFEDAFYPPLNI